MGPSINVGRRETQDVITRPDKSVLPSVITDETVAVIPTIELDHEMSLRVVEVSTPEKPS